VPSPYAVIIDPLANDFVMTHCNIQVLSVPSVTGINPGVLHLQVVEANAGGGGEIPILETAISSVSLVSSVATVNLLGSSFMLPCAPRLIRAGRRLAFRIALSVPNNVATPALALYAVGYAGHVPMGYPLYDYGRRMQAPQYPNNFMRVAPLFGTFNVNLGGAWVPFAPWTTVIDPAPTDLLVYGVTDYGPSSINRGREYLFATGAAGVEVVRAVVPMPGYIVLQFSAGWLWRPLLIKRGERFAITGAKAIAGNDSIHRQTVHYQEI
jgi:hypothetical protein